MTWYIIIYWKAERRKGILILVLLHLQTYLKPEYTEHMPKGYLIKSTEYLYQHDFLKCGGTKATGQNYKMCHFLEAP